MLFTWFILSYRAGDDVLRNSDLFLLISSDTVIATRYFTDLIGEQQGGEGQGVKKSQNELVVKRCKMY